MTVRVYTPRVVGVSLASRFTDSFTRADTARGPGSTDYFMQQENDNGAANDNPSMKILGNQWVWSNATITAQSPGCRAIPRATANSLVFGKNQFAQVTFVSDSGGANRGQLCGLMMQGSRTGRDLKGYMFYRDSLNGSKIQVDLMYVNAAGVTITVNVGLTAGNMANGDVVRVECVPSAASNRLAIIIGGVLQLDTTDNNANRPVSSGLPGLWAFNMFNGEVCTLDDFSCGAGCQFIT